jgi:hypothetical protein
VRRLSTMEEQHPDAGEMRFSSSLTWLLKRERSRELRQSTFRSRVHSSMLLELEVHIFQFDNVASSAMAILNNPQDLSPAPLS